MNFEFLNKLNPFKKKEETTTLPISDYNANNGGDFKIMLDKKNRNNLSSELIAFKIFLEKLIESESENLKIENSYGLNIEVYNNNKSIRMDINTNYTRLYIDDHTNHIYKKVEINFDNSDFYHTILEIVEPVYIKNNKKMFGDFLEGAYTISDLDRQRKIDNFLEE